MVCFRRNFRAHFRESLKIKEGSHVWDIYFISREGQNVADKLQANLANLNDLELKADLDHETKCLCVFIFNIQTNTLNSFSKSYSPSTLYFKGRKQNTSMKRSKVSLGISFGRTWILCIVYKIQSQWLLGSKEDFNDLHIWASSWDYGTYHIGDQRRLGQACAFAQSRQSLRCSHTWLMEVDEESNQNQTSSPIGWLRMHIWRMGLQRTKSTIISWDGSFDL